MTLIKMFDATSADNIPLAAGANPADMAVASYCDGNFANGWIGCVRKYPELSKQQRVVSIASRFSSIARIMDYEPGNRCYGDPNGVAQWVLTMLAHGVQLPGGYADRSDMPALQAAWVKHKVPRDKTVLWLAAPGADPTPYLNQGFDAVQDAFDGKFDVSVCKPGFFPGAAPKPPAPKPTHKATVTFKGNHGSAHVKFHGGRWFVHPDHHGDWTIRVAGITH